APIDRRSAISLSRDAVRASSRLAMFDPAMSRIRPAIAARIHNGRPNSLLSGDGPLTADRTYSGVLAKRSMSSRLRPAAICCAQSLRTVVYGVCSVECYAGIQASHDPEPAELAVSECTRVVGAVRQPDVRRPPGLDAGEC